MAEIKSCLLPEELYYHVAFNVWARDLGDGTFELGMTDIAQSLAGAIIHCRPGKAGKRIKKVGKSVGTVESGKWVGPVKSPFAGEIVARNDAAEADATLLNKSPYKRGWIVRVRPDDAASGLAAMVQGEAAVEGFTKYMEEHELEDCVHCDGFDCD